jgi:GT2 family glycosyltransferase
VVDDGARTDAQQKLPGVRWVQGIKPFNFARNANHGIAASTRDIILLNDDALLLTHGGFTALSQVGRERGNDSAPGAVAAAVKGVVGNPRQKVKDGNALRSEPRQLCFICVYLPRATLEAVGELDIRFDGYGYDDDDYCDRIRAAGLGLAVYDGCVVDHSGVLPSSFRTRQDFHELNERNRQLYLEKQSNAVVPVEHAAPIEVLLTSRIKSEGAFIAEDVKSGLP